MNTSEPKAGERIRNVSVTDDAIIVDLYDGRTRKRGVCPGQWTLSEMTEVSAKVKATCERRVKPRADSAWNQRLHTETR
jgi:hypothetical protein